MKENEEAGEEDEASAQLAVFLSAQTLTAAVVFSLSFHVFFSLVGFVLLQTWPLLPVSVFSIRGGGGGGAVGDSVLCRNVRRKDF